MIQKRIDNECSCAFCATINCNMYWCKGAILVVYPGQLKDQY